VLLSNGQLLRYRKINTMNLFVSSQLRRVGRENEVEHYDGHSIYQLISNQFKVARNGKRRNLKLFTNFQSDEKTWEARNWFPWSTDRLL
jgi:hypothetical protein